GGGEGGRRRPGRVGGGLGGLGGGARVRRGGGPAYPRSRSPRRRSCPCVAYLPPSPPTYGCGEAYREDGAGAQRPSAQKHRRQRRQFCAASDRCSLAFGLQDDVWVTRNRPISQRAARNLSSRTPATTGGARTGRAFDARRLASHCALR